MKRIHFDVEEDGFYGAYWACKDTHTAAGTDSIETVPAILCYIIFFERLFYSHSMVAGGLDVMS